MKKKEREKQNPNYGVVEIWGQFPKNIIWK
jgi:hypothetical protein